MILVTGASGQLGHAIVERLVDSSQPVIAGTRQPAADSEQRHVDFDEPSSLDFTSFATVVMVSAGYVLPVCPEPVSTPLSWLVVNVLSCLNPHSFHSP